MLSGGNLSHQSKLQSTVALSSTEAEYMATTEAGNEALWVVRFLACLGFRLPSQPVNLRADNKGAISLTENPKFYRKTKDIEVRWHRIREKVERKEILILYISTKEMLADGQDVQKFSEDDRNELNWSHSPEWSVGTGHTAGLATVQLTISRLSV